MGKANLWEIPIERRLMGASNGISSAERKQDICPACGQANHAGFLGFILGAVSGGVAFGVLMIVSNSFYRFLFSIHP